MGKIVLSLFGFLRDGITPEYYSKYNKMFAGLDTYIAVPDLVNEDSSRKLTESDIKNIYPDLNIKNLYLWSYDKTIFQNKVPAIVPKFNQWFQQAWRIYSFFYHVYKSVEHIDPSEYDNIDYVIVLRADLDITSIDFNLINSKMLGQTSYDLFVEHGVQDKHLNDKYFIIKPKYLYLFKDLYDNFDKYLTSYYEQEQGLSLSQGLGQDLGVFKPNNTNSKIVIRNGKEVIVPLFGSPVLSVPTNNIIKKQKPESTRPEDIWGFHFMVMHKLKVYFGHNLGIVINFKHVCSRYCGHNGLNTSS